MSEDQNSVSGRRSARLVLAVAGVVVGVVVAVLLLVSGKGRLAGDSGDAVILSLTKPQYPAGLQTGQPDGRVVVHVGVDAAGRVASVTAVRSSGVRELDSAACAAAGSSQFAVRAGRGSPASYRVALAYEFDGPDRQARVSSLRQSDAGLALRPDTVLTVSAEQCDEPPVLASGPDRRLFATGAAIARVMVEADGRAGRVELLEPGASRTQDSLLVEWLRAARFRPGRRNGRPVRCWLAVDSRRQPASMSQP